jgi:methionyl-tRNA formyltransferase
MKLDFVYLVLEEHPYGREMLRILLENGLIPRQIIQEVSAVGDEERKKFHDRIAGEPVPLRLTELITGKKIPVYCVGNHNDEICAELLAAEPPDILVLGGTRIIKSQILELAKVATVNAHPGLLPRLRGSSSPGWALYKDLPQGATAHFVSPGIDTGDIIVSRELAVKRGDTYESINARIATLAGELMAEAIQAIHTGEVTATPQNIDEGETFRVIPDDLLEIGKKRLADGSYAHFRD